ncbi:unnamed protein product [Rangifer tarandus platyrhynchus]|uniref:Uncharacterized protein n=1 Tax=Rangifer tarandus platyrhynchus TaxID=3082113 RepID=A0AC59YS44_RANTA
MRVMRARGGQRGQDPLGQARNVGSDPHRHGLTCRQPWPLRARPQLPSQEEASRELQKPPPQQERGPAASCCSGPKRKSVWEARAFCPSAGLARPLPGRPQPQPQLGAQGHHAGLAWGRLDPTQAQPAGSRVENKLPSLGRSRVVGPGHSQTWPGTQQKPKG